jgi:hypothetical protein
MHHLVSPGFKVGQLDYTIGLDRHVNMDRAGMYHRRVSSGSFHHKGDAERQRCRSVLRDIERQRRSRRII